MSSQTNSVIETIFQQIDDGLLKPGDVIAEEELIEALGISRTPLREALLRLEQIGLVKRQSRKGATLFKPTLEQFLSILEVHASLEGQAAGLAARRINTAQGKLLEEVVEDCLAFRRGDQENDAHAYYQLNLKFHKTVAEAAGNLFLLELIKTNARKLMAYYRARYHYRGTINTSAGEHRQIAELILARKPAEAQELMARHVQFDHVTAMDLLAAVD